VKEPIDEMNGWCVRPLGKRSWGGDMGEIFVKALVLAGRNSLAVSI
jgi:hypothetical protein